MALFDSLLQLDSDLFLFLNGRYTPFWDTVMLFFTRKESWIPLYFMLMVVIFRNYGKKGWVILLCLVAGLVISDQCSGWIKESVQRLRPGHDPALKEVTHIVLRKGGQYGFVSSHAANVVYLLTLTGLIFRNQISFWALFSWALLVSWTRIYTGAHFPLDVAGGWLLGLLIGFLTWKFILLTETSLFYGGSPRIYRNRLTNRDAALLLATLASVAATLLIAAHILHKYSLL